MRECVCECVCVSKLWMCVQCMCASESGRDRECVYVRVRFSLTFLPSQTFSSLARWRGTSPPLRVLQILSKDGNRRLPSTERPEITLYSPLLVSAIQIAASGSPILRAHHSAPGEEREAGHLV